MKYERELDDDMNIDDFSELEFNFDEDQDMKRQRIFQANINRKKKIIENQFSDREDIRKARLLQKVDCENKT